MFTRKKLLDILSISLLISFSIGISFYNLISENFDNSNFAATLLFICIFVMTAVIAYILRDKAMVLFVLCYFTLHSLCGVTGIIMDVFGLSHNAFTVYLSLFFSPFYGLVAISKLWSYIACASAFIITAVSALLLYKLQDAPKKK